MRFVCLIYFDPKTAFDGSPKSNAILDQAGPHAQELRAGGQMLASEALVLPNAAVTVRVRGDKVSTTDGPFAETKEVLGGFVLIEAADIDEAVQMAAANPMAELGCVEVRPVVDFSKPRPVV